MILLEFLGLKRENDVVEAFFFQIGKERHGLDALFNEAQLAVVVLVDAFLEGVLDVRKDGDKLTIGGGGQLCESAVLGCDDLGGTLAAKDDRDFAKVSTWPKQLDVRVNFHFMFVFVRLFIV